MDNLFDVELKISPQCILPFELTTEDSSLIHKCLNKFVSPSYSPLDDSVYESFFHYIHLLYKSTCFVLLEKVTNAFGHKYDSFDEAYQATAKYVVEILEEARSRSPRIYVLNTKFGEQPYCKRLYLRKKLSKYLSLQEVFRESLESPKWKNISFLVPSELESWINLTKQNFCHLKQSAQIFILKFIGLISRNMKCFQLLKAQQVYNLLWDEFDAKDCRIRSLLVQILNSIVSHKDGRECVTKGNGKLDKWCDWREILKAELERNDSSFYYQEVLLDLFLNVTIVTDIGPLITRCTVTREFFKTIISLDLQSKVQMNFVLKLLQRLVDMSYSCDKITSDDMFRIVSCFEKLLQGPIELVDYDMACKFYQIRTYLDRLDMSYDNDVQRPLLREHQNFLDKTVCNLEMMNHTNTIITHKYKLDSSDGIIKWLEYAELCCVVYLSKTPDIIFITPECSNPNGFFSPRRDEIQSCRKTFHIILNSILCPVLPVLKKQKFTDVSLSKNEEFEELYYGEIFGLFPTDHPGSQPLRNKIPAAMKSFACFRRVFPLLKESLMMYRGGFNVLKLIQRSVKDACKDYSQFSSWSQKYPELHVELVRTFEYVTPFDSVVTHVNDVRDILNLAAHRYNEERMVQALLDVLKFLLRKVLHESIRGSQVPQFVYELLEDNGQLVKLLLRSETWEIRDSMLEVLKEGLQLSLMGLRFTGGEKRNGPKNGDGICSHFMTYISLAQNDPERFVRASAVDVIHSKLMLLDRSEEINRTENKDNVHRMVVDALIRICINEHDNIVQERTTNLLAVLFSPNEALSYSLIDRDGTHKQEVIEIMKYYAIKEVESEIKLHALGLFLSRLDQLFWPLKYENDRNDVPAVVTKDGLIKYLIDIKVFLTILLYDEDSATVLYLCQQLICEIINSEHEEGVTEKLMVDILVKMNQRILSINEIIDVHGNLLIPKRDYINNETEGIAHSTGPKESTDLIGEIINTHDIDLLVSSNKPKNRYFSINNNRSNQSSDKTKAFPEFISKRTFFDESLFTDDDVLVIFLSVMSRENLWTIMRRRFGIDINEKKNNWQHKMKSLFNDVLMYDNKKILQDSIDCY